MRWVSRASWSKAPAYTWIHRSKGSDATPSTPRFIELVTAAGGHAEDDLGDPGWGRDHATRCFFRPSSTRSTASRDQQLPIQGRGLRAVTTAVNLFSSCQEIRAWVRNTRFPEWRPHAGPREFAQLERSPTSSDPTSLARERCDAPTTSCGSHRRTDAPLRGSLNLRARNCTLTVASALPNHARLRAHAVHPYAPKSTIGCAA